MSEERLARIDAMRKVVEKGQIPGVVALVARKGPGMCLITPVAGFGGWLCRRWMISETT